MSHSLHIYLAQVNPTVGDLERNTRIIRKVMAEAPSDADLIVFPEMVLTGYPLEDLVLKPSFLDDVKRHVEDIVQETKHHRTALILTTPWAEKGKVYNAFHLVHDGYILATRYKHKLPNYGVFDEARVFHPGDLPDPVEFLGHKLGVMICEDMWSSDVSSHLAKQGAEMLIVTNGSPYDCRKTQARFDLAAERVTETGLPLLYTNLVGGQDELVFDGGSFILNESGTKILQAPYFQDDGIMTVWEKSGEHWLCATEEMTQVPSEDEATYEACMLGLRDYIHKNGMSDVLIGLSGGIDSALTAAIAVDALGAEHVHCVMMPSPFTSEESLDAAQALVDKLGVDYQTIPITPAMETFESLIPDLDGIAHENMQSRTRGLILMSLSNKNGPLVLTTGNKSENAVGYATLYGDMCGAFSVLKDMFKNQVYDLAEWRNKNTPSGALGPDNNVIPEIIITRPPSAELRADQKDQDSLPPYEVLDEILRLIVEEDRSFDGVVKEGFDPKMVEEIWHKVDSTEYKRRQGPPGVKLTTRSFGRERRYPITNNYRPSHNVLPLANKAQKQ